MNRSLLKIAAFSSAIEAEHLRLLLQREGIAAFLDGANTGTTLSHLSSALGGVKVLVSPTDADRAMEIIRASEDPEGVGGRVWFCGECREQVDVDFEVCWSCGQLRVDVEQPSPHVSAGPISAGADEIEDGSPAQPSAHLEPAAIRRDPYAAPDTRHVESAASVRLEPFAPNSEAEATLERAWRASVIGASMLPVVFHIYSVYLLLRASTIVDRFSSKGSRTYFQAWGINVSSGLVWGAFLAIWLQFMT